MPGLAQLLGRERGIEGGLLLPDHKSVTARRPIENVPVDGPLHIPLQASRELPTVVEVAPGEHVIGGQRLARAAEAASLPVHAPTSGKIAESRRVWTPLDGYLPGAVLEPDGRNDWIDLSPTWDTESFIMQLSECGVMCPKPRAALHRLIQDAIAAGAADLIVDAMETEPHLTADLRILVEQSGRIVDTVCEIADALGVRRVILALPYRHRRVVKRLQSEAAGRHIEIVPLANRYPQCHPVLLVKTLLDREVEPGADVLSVGALVLPLSAVRAAADALMEGRPVTHTVLTVAGDVVEHPGTYRVAVGTPLRRLAERAGLLGPVGQAIAGGPLTGTPIGRDDAVATVDCSALLLFSAMEASDPVPCIHCGWCVEDCPVGLEPSALIHLESEKTCDPLSLAYLQACIDCGLCSHVCPSQLPLAASIKRSRIRFTTGQ